MMARFVPMPEYAGVRVEGADYPAEGREIGVRVYSAGSEGPAPVVVFFHGGGWVAWTLETHDPILPGAGDGGWGGGGVGGLPAGSGA